MWRYTLPDRIIVNDSGAYAFAPSHDPVYGESYLFVLGVRGLSPGGERGIETPSEGDAARTRRQAVVEKLERLWIEGARYLLQGRFMDDVGLDVSVDGVLAKVYRGKTGVAVPVWNTTSRPQTFFVRVDLDAVGLEERGPLHVSSLDKDTPLPELESGSLVEVGVSLPPHDVDVLVLEGKGPKGG
jgi:hypothetical protein